MKEIDDVDVQEIRGNLFTTTNKHGRSVKPAFEAKRITVTTDDGHQYEFVVHSWDQYPHFVKRRYDGNKISHSTRRLPQRVVEYFENKWGGLVKKNGLPYVDVQFIDNGVYFCTMYKDPEPMFEG